MIEMLSDPSVWIAFATLTALEIVLGIDNIVFISILVDRLPEEKRPSTRTIGLAMAMVMRILLLFSITWVMGLTKELFQVMEHGFSGRDLILLFGGGFLLFKSTTEIHHALEGEEEEKTSGKAATVAGVIVQIAILDMVFSLDSVITAVGLAEHIEVMIAAVVISVGVMMVSASTIAEFVNKHPTVKMLALTFLTLIGVTLIAEGLQFHIPKGYVYFAMAFSVMVEVLNLRAKKAKTKLGPIQLRPRQPK